MRLCDVTFYVRKMRKQPSCCWYAGGLRSSLIVTEMNTWNCVTVQCAGILTLFDACAF